MNGKSPNIASKVFLVTGGAAGIGAAIVKNLLIEDAAHVVILDIAEIEGSKLETKLNQEFGALRVKFIKCDIADSDQLTSAFQQVMDRYRRLDGLINNAAIVSVEEGMQKRMIDTNFTATVNATLKALSVMRADKAGSGGVILNMASLLALKMTCHLPVYSATKAAVLQFSNCIGMEPHYSQTKVRVLTVCLGPTDTAILHRHKMEGYDINCAECVTLRSSNRQRVTSAAEGIVDVLRRGTSGSTWRIAYDEAPVDISENVQKSNEILTTGLQIKD